MSFKNISTVNPAAYKKAILNFKSSVPSTSSSKSLAVGYGYNVITSPYITPTDIKYDNAIVDPNKMDSLIKKKAAGVTRTRISSGSDAKEYTNDFNTKIEAGGSYLLFSASLKLEFDYKEKSTEDNVYIKCESCRLTDTEYFEGTTYKSYLSAQFKADVLKLTPGQLFEKYGTHLIAQIHFGGRLSFNYLYHKKSDENSTKIVSDVKASFASYTGSVSTTSAETNKRVIENSDITVVTIGGKAYDMSTPDSFKANYSKWLDSITNHTASNYNEICMPCEILSMNNLVPIWKLCSDAVKAKAIEDEFNRLVKLQDSSFFALPKYVDDYCFVTAAYKEGGPVAKRKCPVGYNLVDVDLNAGSGGQYIYLCQKFSETSTTPLTDMFLEYYDKGQKSATQKRTHKGNVANYVMNPNDLNAGAGGKYIYLWTTKDKTATKKPIKEIGAFALSKAAGPNDIPAPWEVVYWYNSNDGGDVNKGAGGKFVYLAVKR